MRRKTLLVISIATTLTSANSYAEVGELPEGTVLSIAAPSKFNLGGFTLYPVSCAGSGVSLTGHKSLFVGPNMGNTGTGTHSGQPASNDVGAATNPWPYFCNTGYDYLSRQTGNNFSANVNGNVDMSAWTVSWNGIDIPAGVNTIFSSFTCGTFCADGDSYTIIHSAIIPNGDPSGFGGVRYDVCLTGTITYPDSLPADTPPVANDDSYNVATGALGVPLKITDNDIENAVNDAIDKSTIDLDPNTAGQQVTFTTANGGTVTLVPDNVIYDAGISGTDTFTYTVNDFRGPNISNVATVSIEIGNLAPVCNDDGITEGALFVIGADSSIIIDVLGNDTDANAPVNDIDPVTTTQTGPGGLNSGMTGNGSLLNNGDGTFTYTPNPGFLGPTDSFTYSVSDNSTDPSPFACADATVIITVADYGPAIGNVENAYLAFDTGVVGNDNKIQPAPGEGSWFSMELAPGVFTYTPMSGFDHIQLGTTQPALSPNQPGIDNPWVFFGNFGVHQTTSDMIQLSNSNGTATLDFSGWDISWNGIPGIPMNKGLDNGVATLTCYKDLVAGTPGIGSQSCDAGDEFILTYRATVPSADVSGYGGVKYVLHLEGKISPSVAYQGCGETTPSNITTFKVISDCTSKMTLSMSPGDTSSSIGNLSGLYLRDSDIGSTDPLLNPKDGQQCIGGCLDFVIKNVAIGGEVNLVVKLFEEIPEGAIYRKLLNGVWKDFDTSSGDQVGSAPLDAITNNCQNPEGRFQTGLRAGSRCLFLKITDGGPNDADGIANGIIVDPSGVSVQGTPVKTVTVAAETVAVTNSSGGGGLYFYTLLVVLLILLFRVTYRKTR